MVFYADSLLIKPALCDGLEWYLLNHLISALGFLLKCLNIFFVTFLKTVHLEQSKLEINAPI